MELITPTIKKKEEQICSSLMRNPSTYKELSKKLGIERTEVMRYAKKLIAKKAIYKEQNVKGRGSKTILYYDFKTNYLEYVYNFKINILNKIKNNGGRITKKDFYDITILGEEIEEFRSLQELEYSPYLRHELVLTKEGKDYIKKYRKK